MGGYSRVNEGLPNDLEPGQSAFLVNAHEAAITGDIRRQHCRQPPLHLFPVQTMPLETENQPAYSSMLGHYRASANVLVGSKTAVAALRRDVAFTPENDGQFRRSALYS